MTGEKRVQNLETKHGTDPRTALRRIFTHYAAQEYLPTSQALLVLRFPLDRNLKYYAIALDLKTCASFSDRHHNDRSRKERIMTLERVELYGCTKPRNSRMSDEEDEC